jgi:hypothetical protein
MLERKTQRIHLYYILLTCDRAASHYRFKKNKKNNNTYYMMTIICIVIELDVIIADSDSE